MLHVLCLRHDLEAVVPVEIMAIGGIAGVVHARIDIFFRHEDEKDFVQQICHINGSLFGCVVTVKPVHHAGIHHWIGPNRTQIIALIFNQLRSVQSHFLPLLLEFSLSFLREAGELRVCGGGLLDQLPGKFQYRVRRGDLVGVYVGIQDRHLIVIISGVLEFLYHRGSGFFRLFREIQPLLYGCAVAGDDEVRHIITKAGLSHHTVFHVWFGCGAVVVSFSGEPLYLIKHLPHGVERGVGFDGDVFQGSQSDSVQFGGKIKLTADIQKPAAAFMGYTNIGTVLDGSGGEIEFQCGTVQRSLKALHGKSLTRFLRITESDRRKVDRFFFVRVHLFFAVEGDEIPVRRVGVRCKPLEGPGHLVRTGFLNRGGLLFGERKDQRFAGLFRQWQKELGCAVHFGGKLLPGSFLSGLFFPGRSISPGGTGAAAECQRKHEERR